MGATLFVRKTTAQRLPLNKGIYAQTTMEPSSDSKHPLLALLNPKEIVLQSRSKAERDSIRTFAEQLLFHLDDSAASPAATSIDYESQYDDSAMAARPLPRQEQEQHGTPAPERHSDSITPAADSSRFGDATPLSSANHKKRKAIASNTSELFSPLRRQVAHASPPRQLPASRFSSTPPHGGQQADPPVSTTPTLVLKRSDSMLEADNLQQQNDVQIVTDSKRSSVAAASTVPAAPFTQAAVNVIVCSPGQSPGPAATVVPAASAPTHQTASTTTPTAFDVLMDNSKLQFSVPRSPSRATSAKSKSPPALPDERWSPVEFNIQADGTTTVSVISDDQHRPLPTNGEKLSYLALINIACRRSQEETNGGKKQRRGPVVTFDMLLHSNMADTTTTTSATPPTHQRSWFSHPPSQSCAELQSLLQQHVRAHRTASSVRVAMALAERNLPALLCYLPVLILRETILHPDLAVVVWLALAHKHSRGYYVCPEYLVMRILRIVYEVASCPRPNDLTVPDSTQRDTSNPVLTISSLADLYKNREALMNASRKSFVLLWSMLLYENCIASTLEDRHTLRNAIQVWTCRFGYARSTLPPPGTYSGDGGPSIWYDVPDHVHEKARQNSMSVLSAMCEELPFDRLPDCDSTGAPPAR